MMVKRYVEMEDEDLYWLLIILKTADCSPLRSRAETDPNAVLGNLSSKPR